MTILIFQDPKSELRNDDHASTSGHDRIDSFQDQQHDDQQPVGNDIARQTIQEEEEKRNYQELWHSAYKRVCADLGIKVRVGKQMGGPGT